MGLLYLVTEIAILLLAAAGLGGLIVWWFYNRRLDALNDQLVSIRGEFASWRDNNALHRTDIDAVEERITAISNAPPMLPAGFDDVDLADVKSMTDAMAAQVDRVERSVNDVESRFGDVDTKLAAIRGRLEVLDGRIGEEKVAVGELAETFTGFRNQIKRRQEGTDEELGRLMAAIVGLREPHDALVERVNALKGWSTAHDEVTTSLRDDVERAQDAMERLQAELTTGSGVSSEGGSSEGGSSEGWRGPLETMRAQLDGLDASVADHTGRIFALGFRTAEAERTAPDAAPADEALATRLAALEERFASGAAAADDDDGGDPPRWDDATVPADLNERLLSLEARLGELATAESVAADGSAEAAPAAASDLAPRLEALEAKLHDDGEDTPDFAPRIDALEAKLQEVGEAASAIDVDSVMGRLAAVEARGTELDGTMQAWRAPIGGLEEVASGLDQRLAEIEGRDLESTTSVERIAQLEDARVRLVEANEALRRELEAVKESLARTTDDGSSAEGDDDVHAALIALREGKADRDALDALRARLDRIDHASRPAVLLSEPTQGPPDDLKVIKGVGPKLEGLLHRLGIYYYAQIAAFSDSDIDWVDSHLESFQGRVRRDGWVAQAGKLADEAGPHETPENDASDPPAEGEDAPAGA